MGRSRCVCGRSKTYPLCDGSHAGEEWACAVVESVATAVVAAPALQNMGRRLAASLKGRLVDTATPTRAHRLVALSDGTDLDWLRPVLASIQAEQRELVVVGVSGALLASAFQGMDVVEVADGPGSVVWGRIQAALKAGAHPAPSPHRRWFLSHASADEAALEPAAAYLREELGLELFLCSDSIQSGTAWQERIVTALDDADALLFVLSRASAASTFCAWELGFAMARDKDIRVVRIDDAPAPATLQHLHMQDLQRTLNSRPWLDADEALLQLLLAAMATS